MTSTAVSQALVVSYSWGWGFKEKLQGISDSRDETLMCCCKGTKAWGHACLEVSSLDVACGHEGCYPSSPWGLTAPGAGRAAELRWAVKAAWGDDAVRNGPLKRTLRGDSTERRALEIWDFDGSCYLRTACWVCNEWAFVLKGFAAREKGGGCLW